VSLINRFRKFTRGHRLTSDVPQEEVPSDVFILDGSTGPTLDLGGGPKGIEVDENRIYFYSQVGDKEIFELNKLIRHLDIEMQCLALRLKTPPIPIELHIHSAGGDLFSGLAAADVIRNCKTPLHTYVNGSTASAATLISICGKKRFIYKNAFMLIHQITTLMVHGKFEEFKDELQNQEQLMERIKSIYLSRTKLTEDKVEELLKHDLWLNAETCLEYGLVDKII
jgi:ATP-dependent protease ClpP protease subunit